ncbi:MAG: GtrA family protein [Eubacteriales bacterium]|nr:GtrA family protein [Eubacteriales bacterium]
MNLKENTGEILRYLIVGGLTTVVSLGSYYLAITLALDPRNAWQLQAANIISWICAVAFAYFTNRKYVFRSRDPHMVREAEAFVSARLGSLGLDMGLMFLMVTLLRMDAVLAKIIVQFAVTVANYVLSKFWVFHGGREMA